MIGLDDPRWKTLTHAYGGAADIPERLAELSRDTSSKPRNGREPWFTLWSSLCHQGDVFDASYAAVPHIVAMALAAPDSIDFSFFQLPAAIEVARVAGRGPAVPPDLAPAYARAITGLPDCVARHRHHDWDEATAISALAALAVAKGLPQLAEAIMNLDDDSIARLIACDFGG
ncbi:hypothetical protein MTR62_04890 [Novosphingobium sp. 1949]|uniref:Uncharacterized protein n=1 Tax=Novosphingobium organovorum TaxID=2930092 RepID=A0ABT0BB46_9SPHN|nr:hypothetical protein [Novosphingobium organovorum]MCJ2182041.1 hypothetical protein [Novosphingobium organovorum]